MYYGTLKNQKRDQSTQTPDCKVKGFALWKWRRGWYPLALPHKRGTIQATLHDFSQMSKKDFAEMVSSVDSYEGCMPANPEHSLYHRILVDVELPAPTVDIKIGKAEMRTTVAPIVKAYMYMFNKARNYEPMFRIPQGNWDNKDKIKVWTEVK